MAVDDNAPKDYSSSNMSTIDRFSKSASARGQDILDRYIPPERREDIVQRMQAYVYANPKLSIFIAVNLALTGLPVISFVIFTISTATFALCTGLLAGLLGGIMFSLSCAGFALTILLPTVLFTTAAACLIFCWGLGSYYIVQCARSIAQGSSGATRSEKTTMLDDADNESLNSYVNGT